MGNRGSGMKRQKVQNAVVMHIEPDVWLSAKDIARRLSTVRRSGLVGVNGKHLPDSGASVALKIKGDPRIEIDRTPKGRSSTFRYRVKSCFVCGGRLDPVSTPMMGGEPLCSECFNDLMDQKHADYLAFMDEVSA